MENLAAIIVTKFIGILKKTSDSDINFSTFSSKVKSCQIGCRCLVTCIDICLTKLSISLAFS